VNNKVTVQAHIETQEENIIGVKEHIAYTLERLGFTVDYINVETVAGNNNGKD
jgi:hypothetical protein